MINVKHLNKYITEKLHLNKNISNDPKLKRYRDVRSKLSKYFDTWQDFNYEFENEDYDDMTNEYIGVNLTYSLKRGPITNGFAKFLCKDVNRVVERDNIGGHCILYELDKKDPHKLYFRIVLDN